MINDLSKLAVKTNWITYLVMFLVFVFSNTFFTPLELGNTRNMLFLYALFQFLTYGIIPSIIILLFFALIDLFFFRKGIFKKNIMLHETIFLIAIVAVFSLFSNMITEGLFFSLIIIISQFLRMIRLANCLKNSKHEIV